MTSYDNAILAESSLINYFPLGEAVGSTTVADIKGGLVGTVGGVVLGAAGLLNDGTTAARFDGVSSYIATPVLGAPSGDRSFEAWIYYDSSGNAQYPVLFEQTGQNASRLFVNNNNGNIGYGVFGMTGGGNPSDAPYLGTPTLTPLHFVYTQSAGQSQVYLNGLAIGSASLVLPDNLTSGSGRIGNASNFNFPWKGFIQKFATYSAALNQSQVSAHLAAGGGKQRQLSAGMYGSSSRTKRTAQAQTYQPGVKTVRSPQVPSAASVKTVRTLHTGYPNPTGGGGGPVRPSTGQVWPRGVAGR